MAVEPSLFLARENHVTYAFYATVLVFKIMLMGPLTARYRFGKKIFANPEDAKMLKGKVNLQDPDIERVRRAHLNDLENIPAFLFVSFLYVLTDPVPSLALLLFRVYTAARVVHTLVYAVVPMPQPSRVLAFIVGQVVISYMVFSNLAYFWAYNPIRSA